MNERIEPTDEMINDAIICGSHDCLRCKMPIEKRKACTSMLASALQAERAKVKDDVWKDAPDNANGAMAYYFVGGKKQNTTTCYTRELPKSRIDLIAEKAWSFCSSGNKEEDIAVIKSAILEAMGCEK